MGELVAYVKPQPMAKGRERTRQEFKAAVQHAYTTAKAVKDGKNADYIPELAKVDANLFGIVLMKVDGEMFEIGDTATNFTIQSISKIFTLSRALKDSPGKVEKSIGTDATGQSFNSILALGLNKANKRPVPGNPLVNAGAIATVGLVAGADANEKWSNIIGTMNAFAGRSLSVDSNVYKSETETNAGNQGISWILKNWEVLEADPPQTLDLYTRQCSVAITARDLAAMGATLANGGVNPITNMQVIDPELAAEVLAVMSTAGLYETTGTWLFKVGAPAKSGVGGGIIAVVPGQFAVAAFAPPLDEAGNSVKAQRAIESIISELGANVFMAQPRTKPTQSAGAEPGHEVDGPGSQSLVEAERPIKTEAP
jgi:glutaminase